MRVRNEAHCATSKFIRQLLWRSAIAELRVAEGGCVILGDGCGRQADPLGSSSCTTLLLTTFAVPVKVHASGLGAGSGGLIVIHEYYAAASAVGHIPSRGETSGNWLQQKLKDTGASDNSKPNKVDLLVGVVTKNIPRTCIFFIIANPSPIGLFKPISQDPLLILNWSELRLMGSRNLKMCLIGKV